MAIKHLLIDLDDTLLINSTDIFIPAYFKALSKHLAKLVDPAIMLPALIAGTKAMTTNLDADTTLEQAFDRIFYPQIGIPKSDIHGEIDAFYTNVFPELKSLTSPHPGGVDMVDQAIQAGYSVSIATNPLFPRTAITQRIEWAGFVLSKNQFNLIPSYEVFHFAKPNQQFYHEFVSKIGTTTSECVMIGNDFEMDIEPSLKVGISAFYLTSKQPDKPGNFGWGPLNQVIKWLR